MENIKVFKLRQNNLGSSIVAQCFDFDRQVMYLLSPQLQLFSLNISPKGIQEPQAFLTISFDDITDPRVEFMEHMIETLNIIVVFKCGTVIRVNLATNDYAKIKKFKSVHSIKLTNNQDLFAIADEENNILLTDQEFSDQFNITTNAITNESSTHVQVGVGWGSKETQFFGLDGRKRTEAPTNTSEPINEEDKLETQEIIDSQVYKQFEQKMIRNTVLDWRGDDQLLASLTYLENSDRHVLKIWNRKLELLYISDKFINIQRGLMSWIRKGPFICCVQQDDKLYSPEVILIERNGMVHQRFSLPKSIRNLHISLLSWSLDSKIFLILGNQFEKDSYSPILFVYTMSNFKYYLKFTEKLDTNCEYQLRWDLINTSKFHLIANTGIYKEYTFHSLFNISTDKSTVAVIDSNKVMLTPLDICKIPPPMFALSIEFPMPIYSFYMSSSDASKMMVMDYTGNIFVSNSVNNRIKPNNSRPSPLMPKVINISNMASIDAMSNSWTNWISYDASSIYGYSLHTLLDDNSIISIQTEGSCRSAYHTTLAEVGLKNDRIISYEDDFLVDVLPMKCMNQLNVAFISSRSIVYKLNFSNLDDKMENIVIDNESNKNEFKVVNSYSSGDSIITLSDTMTLRWNETIIELNSCTSFRVTKHFLAYTTTDNLFHLVQVVGDELYLQESWTHPIEDKAILVSINEKLGQVVLQMPRGNLEILHPRLLIASLLIDLLDNSDYQSAIKLARRHRMNLNIISDYLVRIDPNITDFALSVDKINPSLLILFISELENIDTLTGRYSGILKSLRAHKNIANKTIVADNKISTICASLKFPENLDYLEPRLLSLIRQTPSKIDQALRLVYELVEKTVQQSALKFMLYFIDIDELFKQALGTYDTQIALMVAKASNKDPKDYLALLTKFDETTSETYKKYLIDYNIQEYASAFSNLYRFYRESRDKNLFPKLVDLVESKRLYKQSIKIVGKVDDEFFDSQLLAKLWSSYGSYLFKKGYHSLAAQSYTQALSLDNNVPSLSSALMCFKLADQWKNALAAITKYQLMNDYDSCKRFHDELSLHLRLNGLLLESCFVSCFNLSSHCVKFENYLEKGEYALAYASLANSNDREFKESKLESTIVSRIEELCSEWKSELDQIKKHFDRLKYLISTHQLRKSDITANNAYHFQDTLSTVADSVDTSTVADSTTNKSAQTHETLKTRKKSKKTPKPVRKRISLVENSKYEDIAIIVEIKKFITKQKSNQDEAFILATASYQFTKHTIEKVQLADQISNALKCDDFIKEMMDVLWPLSHEEADATNNQYSLFRRFGNLDVDLDILIRPDYCPSPQFLA